MGRKQSTTNSQFTRFLQSILVALRELGGSGRPAEVKDRIAKRERLEPSLLAALNKSGETRFSNQVDWARFYLVRSGYLDSSKRGVWTLTEKGRVTDIDAAKATEIVRLVTTSMGDSESEPRENSASEPPDIVGDYRERTLEVLRTLPPKGFENLCQLLLRESGFEEVNVTGRSGDGGIDGEGLLKLNAFVSFRVLFQCKRYRDAVGPDKIRDFRGAMAGRAEKGIILTTGHFSTQATNEATRDGAQPIELIDGEELVELLAKLELGLRPRTTYELDESFYAAFRS